MTVRFKRFGIELFHRSAVQTAPVSRFSLRKRAADIVVPTAEKFCD